MSCGSEARKIAPEELRRILQKSRRRAHFIGIGGIGMSGLAQALLARGWQVSGSDMNDSELLTKLSELGATIFVGHHIQHLPEVDLVVISDAITADNPELFLAQKRALPIVRRSQLLGQLTAEMRVIAIAGTHGKTTTSAMTAAILSRSGLSPTMFLGGEYPPLGGNAHIGQSDLAVVEACEAFSSFLDLSPEIAVITNIEAEHLDQHGSEEALRNAFLQFLRQVKPEGAVVVCLDSPELLALAQAAGINKIVSYSLQQEADFQATQITPWSSGSEFFCQPRGLPAVTVRLQVPGRHNVANALAAIAVSSLLDIEIETAARALEKFSGVKRRFQIIAHVNGITVIDDYAHHPTEIAAVFAAIREHYRGRLLAIFQPHLYSRTKFFMEAFARVLSQADLTWVTDIYPAREAPLPGVTAEQIARIATENYAGKVEYLPFDTVAAAVAKQLQEGDIVVTLGAGNVDSIARSLAGALSPDKNFHV